MDSPADLLTSAAGFTGGHLFGFFLVAVFFILFMQLKRFETEHALVSSAWVTAILGALLSFGGFVNILYPLGFLLLAGLTSLWSHATNRS